VRDLPPHVREVIALARGPLLDGHGDVPGSYRPVASLAEARAGIASGAWVDLRSDASGMVGAAVLAAQPSLGVRGLIELERSIERQIEPALAASLPPAYADLAEDITTDLGKAAVGRLVGVHTVFERLLEAYAAGALPCGWDGELEDGILLVYVPPTR